MKVKKSQGGFIVTIELLIIATILVLGLITGWAALRDSVLAELSDLSESVGNLNQGYNIASIINAANSASTAGSSFLDAKDNSTNGTVDVDSTTGGDSKDEYTYNVETPGAAESTTAPVL